MTDKTDPRINARQPPLPGNSTPGGFPGARGAIKGCPKTCDGFYPFVQTHPLLANAADTCVGNKRQSGGSDYGRRSLPMLPANLPTDQRDDASY
jgi:hypothetical protein